MMGNQPIKFVLLIFSVICFVACTEQYSPKPRGYYRIIFPAKQYLSYQSGCPFIFDYPDYSFIEPDQTKDTQWCWLDMVLDDFNARLHLSYMPISGSDHFKELVEDARSLAYSHTVRASAIRQLPITIPERDVHGVFYEIHGNTASSLQFFITDSTHHYLRGALYFDEKPRVDSIQPVIDFIRIDMDRMIQSVRWK